MNCDGVLDLETAEWDRFVLGVTFDGDTPRIFRDLDALLDDLRRRGGTWWAHAGGVFDLLALLERARVRGIPCQADRAQHRVTRIVMGSLTLRDSYALWPVPLDELAGAIGAAVPALPWACICGKACGGYCQIVERAIEGDPDLDAYCIADCRVLYAALQHLRAFAADHAIDLRGTLGHTAWMTAQAELGVPSSDLPWALWDQVRRGDKGGRVAIVRPIAAGPGLHYDICNAYPAQLAKTMLPVGRPRRLGAAACLKALARERPGIYTLTVRVPDNVFLPPLPWRHHGQLSFPTGKFTGSWPLPEIGAALDRGCEIVAGHAAVTFEATAPIFAELVERWYQIRHAVGRKTPLGQWVGRLAKALTGKFAERPQRSRVTMHPAEIKFCTHSGPCRDGCTGACGAYEQIDLLGEIWAIPYQKLGPSAYPQWSAYLRAHTRLQWLEQAERFGGDLCFGNTDSLWTIGRKVPRPTGSQLGQWERQGQWRELEVRSAGVYSFRDASTGTLEIRGVPGLTEADWVRGTGIIDRGVMTFARAASASKGLFRRRSRRWSLPNHEREIFGDRKIGSGGVTVPLAADEIRERARTAARRRRA